MSVLIAGASWDWTESERDAVRDLVVFLEDRRALTQDHHREDVRYVVESILRIRDELTKTLQRLPEGAKSAVLVRDMRTACLAFLDAVQADDWMTPVVIEELGALRAEIGINLSVLVEKFGIPVHGPLVALLPQEPASAEDTGQ